LLIASPKDLLLAQALRKEIMENLNLVIEYAPTVLVILMFLLHNKFFVTPEQLERRHRDIIKEVENRFAPLISMDELKQQFSEVKEKIDKIYEYFMRDRY